MRRPLHPLRCACTRPSRGRAPTRTPVAPSLALAAALAASTSAVAAPVEIEIEDEPEEDDLVLDVGTTPAPTTAEPGTPTTAEPGTPADPGTTTTATATATTTAATTEASEANETQAAPKAEIEALKERLDQLERAQAPASDPKEERNQQQRGTSRRRPTKWWAAASSGTGDDARPPSSAGFDEPVAPEDYGVRLGGYVQVQYLHSQLSEDQLQQGGVVLNRDRFMVRRGRLRAAGDWRFFAFEFELDGSTTRGPFVGVRQANVSALWRHRDPSRVPYVQVTAGLTEIPFGHELRVGQRDLLFMERSLGSLAFFPGPVDVGVRVRGGVGPLRYDVAVVNGSPLDDRADGPSALDPTRRPDFAGRLGFEALPSIVSIGGGASFLAGTGFHPGREATKNLTQWQDLNENGALDSGEITSIPGTAAGPSENFGRWAVGADLELGVRTKTLGWTALTAEATLAQNLDRGLFPADPVVIGADVRHLQALLGLTQDLGRWAAVGLRYDLYDPNTDLLDRRRGETVPRRSDIHTISPLVAARLPAGITPGFRGRLVIQYDAVLDHLGRDERGVPTNLRNDQLVVRLQGEF